MKFTKALAAVLLLLGAASVLAAPADRPCREDVQTYCADAVGDRRAIGQCIRENLDKVSERCRVAVAERMEARRAGGGRRGAPPDDGESAEDQ